MINIKFLIRNSIALLLLFIFSPLFIIIAIVLILDDGFPILFKQNRVGKNKMTFLMYKFRTMKLNTGDIPTHLVKEGQIKYTSAGPFLRKYSLDELPQLINILKGDIVFIGPRPALYNQYDLIEMREKKGINILTPGITGWAQINGRDELTLIEKVEMDKYYLQNESIYLDIKIFWLTILKVLSAKNVGA